jgi:hypothetical protein
MVRGITKTNRGRNRGHFFCEAFMTPEEQTKQQRLKAELKRGNEALDTGADTLLEKLRKSKWTGWILTAAALILIALLWHVVD